MKHENKIHLGYDNDSPAHSAIKCAALDLDSSYRNNVPVEHIELLNKKGWSVPKTKAV